MGYSGGKAPWPTYKSIGDHTEAIRVVYDSQKLSYEDILKYFIAGEGGPPPFPAFSRQYRWAIFTHNAEQKRIAEATMAAVRKVNGARPIFVDIEDAGDFYRAEEYHQKFYEKQCR